jgi:hypothetical protein
MPTRNTGAGGVRPDQESSPPPLSSPRFQNSPHPPGGSDPARNDSPSANSARSEQEQHLNFPSTRTNNYRATVEDVTDEEDEDEEDDEDENEDEDEDEDEYDTTTSRRSSSSHSSSNPFHFGQGPPNWGSSPSGDNLGHNHTEPAIERTYHPHLTGNFLFTSFYLI